MERPRRRLTSKRPVGTDSVDDPVGTVGASNPLAPTWNESIPNWTGAAWQPRNRRAESGDKNKRSERDNKRAEEPTKEVDCDPSSAHDPVADPNVDDLPPLNARLVARKPSPQEVLEHNVTHLPYRAWCETCVASRGVDDPHRRRPFDERMSEGEIDKVFFDFAFFRLRLGVSFGSNSSGSV